MDKVNQVYKAMRSASTVPMSPDLTKIFVNLVQFELRKLPVDPEMVDHWICQAGIKRAKVIGLNVTPTLVLLLCCIEGSIGSVVMYLHFLRWLHKSDTVIDISKLAEYFPTGFYSEDQMQEFWEMQKQESGNMVDRELREIIDAQTVQ